MRFDSYHPTINLIYFTAAIGLTISFNHPAYVAISYAAAFAYSVKLSGKRAVIFNLCLVPFALIYSGWYSYYNHFGVIMFFSCVFAVFSSDKIVYLFGRVSPKLSLFLSIILRMVPRIKQYGRRINTAQKGIGKSPSQGNLWRRFVNSIRLISILITWTLENFVESSDSMKCRGYSLKGRTSFSIYRFDNRDRSFVIAIFLLLIVTACGWALDQTSIHYNPQIIMTGITFMSYIFYAAYGILLLLPMILQIAGERKFERLRAR